MAEVAVKRRSGFAPTGAAKGAALHELLWNKCDGHLMDFLRRGGISEQEFHQHVVGLLAEQGTPAAATSYGISVQTLYREILVSAMRSSLCDSWRPAAGSQSGRAMEQFRSLVFQIAKLKQQSRCLKVEVDGWFRQHHVLSPMKRSRERCKGHETMEQRFERMKEFWPRFHNSHAKSKPRPSTALGVRSDAPQMLSMPPSPSRGSRNEASSATVDSFTLPELTNSHAQWKLRAARSLHATTTRAAGALSPTWSPSRLAPLQAEAMQSPKATAASRAASAPRLREVSTASPAASPSRRAQADLSQTEPAPTRQPLGATMRTLGQTWWGGSGAKSVPTLPPRGIASTLQDTLAGKHATKQASNRLLLPMSAPRTTRLPDIRRDFHIAPFRAGGRRHPQPSDAVDSYVQACEDRGILPTPVAFATGHSLSIDGRHRGMQDLDLLALATVVRASGAETIELEGNPQISDGALAEFLRAVAEQPKEAKLTKLDLAGCHVGEAAVNSIVQLMQEPARAYALTHLDVSGVAMGTRVHLALARVIGSHMLLSTVRLADTGFGHMTAASEQCLTEILGSKSLRRLDLSWSCFNSTLYSHLGELVPRSELSFLNIANSASATSEVRGITPVAYFIERLTRDAPLTHLDISLNRIDFRCALVLEVSLQGSRKLARLDIGQNPLGPLGMRSVLRLLCRNDSGLVHFRAPESGSGDGTGVHTDLQVFSAAKPDGRYSLDLARPYHRALLRMLYLTCDRFGLSPQDAFAEVVAAPAYSHPDVGPGGLRSVPQAGKLSLTFSCDKAYQKALQGVGDDAFGLFLQRRLAASRLQLGFKKARPLLAQWQSCEGLHGEQLAILEALSKDFVLRLPYLEHLCRSRSLIGDILGRLLPCLVGGRPALFMGQRLSPTLTDYARMLHQANSFLTFNVENPTGQHRLDLSNAADSAILERVGLLDAWETATRARLGRTDTSQLGDGSHVRNATFQERPLPANLAEWNMPEAGRLELDYASSRRPPAGAKALDDATWEDILAALSRQATASEHIPLRMECLVVDSRLQALRAISHEIAVTSGQLRRLLDVLPTEAARADAVVTMFTRVTDMENEVLFRSRLGGHAELQRVRHRLGHANYFPFLHPERSAVSLDLTRSDERLAASLLVTLAFKENAANLRNCSYVRADGSVDAMVAGAPKSWEAAAKVPKEGVFHASYACAPSERKVVERAKLFETVGFLNVALSESEAPAEEVQWCAYTADMPTAITEYVTFLLRTGGDVSEAFAAISGGKAGIIPRDLEDALQGASGGKFRGWDSQRTSEFFRFLGLATEGQITQGEWSTLELLCKEAEVGLRDFVAFADRLWPPGSPATMAMFWSAVVGPVDETISSDAWASLVLAHGYYGPSASIFSYVDQEAVGRIGAADFDVLAKFRGGGA